MYFKRIDMQGFKSFAEPVSIEFNDGITCIVGPNGSGKSNISDAIRWVLGEQSPKMLRGGKMEEVIFAGTASRKSRGMAEVTLTIDNSTGILPIDYSEVAITRRMYRSGESEYAINNHACRLRDIRELIMDTGIGVDGYSIIGQGKISDIVSGKPESRREIFEEAAGVVMYRSKKAEAERKLEASAANLERANDIVSELEARMPQLEEESKKASEYLELRERYKLLEVNITLNEIDKVDLKSEYLKDEVAEATAAIEDIREGKGKIDAEVETERQKSESLDALHAETTNRLLESVQELGRLTNKSQLDTARLEAMDKDDARLSEEIRDMEIRVSNEEANSAALFANKNEIDKKAEELQADLRDRTQESLRVTNELTDAALAVDDAKDRLFELKRKISDKEAEAKSLAGMSEAMERRRLAILAERGEESPGEALEKELASLQREEAALSEDLAAKRLEAEKFAKARAEAEDQVKTYSLKSEDARINIGRAEARRRTIEEMEANYEGYNGAVRFIMKEKLEGIEGVVADLMTVPEGFEIAIETALGASMQNIVCADDEAAKRGVAALKEAKAGRLTFLPVGSIFATANRDRAVENAKGFKGWATDCIKTNVRYTKIFEYLLGRTVVMDNISNAIAASKNARGLRFVSLEGEIISAAGAITGGAYKNKTANILERKAEIEKLAADIQRMSEERKDAEALLASARKAVDEALAGGRATAEAEKALEMDIVSKQAEIRLLQANRDELETARAKQDRELAGIEAEQKSSGDMVSAIEKEIKKLEADSLACEQDIEKAMAAHAFKKEEADAIAEEITKARMAASTCETEKAGVDAIVERIRVEIEGLKAEIEARKAARDANAEERKLILSGEGVSPEEIEAKSEEKQRLETYLDELASERAEVSRAFNEASRRKDDLDRRLEEQQTLKYEAQNKLDRSLMQLENYKTRLWDEFEISYAEALAHRDPSFATGSAVRENRQIKARMRELGDVNIGSIKEYESVSERHTFLVEQRDDILKATEALKKIIEDMDRTIKEQFKESFDKIVENFEQVFVELFGGGHAQLRLEDENNPLETGIEIIAQPPGKKLQNLNLMSGGEKTMTAIALMFAVLKAKPTPFCILDEVEAALDDANIERFAEYLKKFDDIQFALITHQKATMEHADVLYGVTMPEQGISKLLSLKLGDEIDLD